MKNQIYSLLEELNIDYQKVEHPPLYSYYDKDKYNVKLDGILCKNLFLRNKDKSVYYLIVMPGSKKLDMKKMENILDSTKLSFASEIDLDYYLSTTSGSVSIFNLINLKESNKVKIYFDKDVINSKKISFHPNINTETLVFLSVDLDKIFDYYKLNYELIEIED